MDRAEPATYSATIRLVTGKEDGSAYVVRDVPVSVAVGTTLLLGESSLSGSNIFRFDVTGAAPTQVAESSYSNGYGFPYPPRTVLPTPDGAAVYYAAHLLDGTNLTDLLHQQTDPIRAVMADGLLATSSTKVYRLSDGLELGTLSASGALQAAGPDGKTVYVYTGAAITRVDLSGY